MHDTKRPYVICHMMPSIDGRIVTRDWNLQNTSREYERTAATFDADAWIIGRISMDPYAGKARVPVRTRKRDRSVGQAAVARDRRRARHHGPHRVSL
jgi:2,5-diamino-6-(ribosylamino)-4(3H)-pyrimidinone 5'-phosphate reductase